MQILQESQDTKKSVKAHWRITKLLKKEAVADSDQLTIEEEKINKDDNMIR